MIVSRMSPVQIFHGLRLGLKVLAPRYANRGGIFWGGLAQE